MATTSTPTTSPSEQAVHAPRLGAPGDTCRACSAPLATDQRYCLNCGARRADAPLRFLDEPGTAAAIGAGDHVAGLGTAASSPVGGVIPPARATTNPEQRPVAIIAAVATMLLALGVGVLIGNAGDGDPPRPTIVTVAGASAAPAAAAAASFASDWPAGTEGFTVALQELPKASTQPSQVAAAKAAATASGAAAVGALDTDAYASLTAGSYLVYSGVFETRKLARAALADLRDAFPAARVVQVGVGAGKAPAAGATSGDGDRDAQDGGPASDAAPTLSDGALEEQKNATPETFQKRSKKLPDKVQSEGAPPPTDDAPAGGGSDAETFG